METSLLSKRSITLRANAAFSISGRRSFYARRATQVTMRSSCPSPASFTASNFYKVLALESENVGADAIKRAYRSMALRHHPDVCPAAGKAEATRRFIEIKKAYETLSNPALREKYDHQLGLADMAGAAAAAAAATAAERGAEEIRRAAYTREVWMEQLDELKARSSMRKKRTDCNVRGFM